jgi:DNA-binding LytR/AlgR family response regulator
LPRPTSETSSSGLGITEQLEEAGAQVVGPIGWLDEALTFIKDNGAAFDGAVLDVSLHGKKSYPIADALAANGVYVVFSTGYGADAVDGDYRRYPRCEKPFTQDELITALAPGISPHFGS